MFNMTVNKILEEDLCIGCGACVTICSQQVLGISFNSDTVFYKAYIRNDRAHLCNECGLCLKVCPSASVGAVWGESISKSDEFDSLKLEKFLMGCHIAIYSGHASDRKIRHKGSSGGVATVILMYMLRKGLINGAIIALPFEKHPLRHRLSIVRSVDDVLNYSDTVYCQTEFHSVFNLLNESNDTIAIVGLPCQLRALTHFLNTKRIGTSKVMKIGLFCGGTNSHQILKFLCHRKRIDPETVTRIRYRSGGWPGRKMVVTYCLFSSDNNQKLHRQILFDKDNTLMDNLIYSFCFSGPFFPKVCRFCTDQTAEYADLSLGDAWLPRFMLYDKEGTNLIIVRSNRGKNILEGAIRAGYVNVALASPIDITRSQGNCLVGRKLGLWCKSLSRGNLKTPVGKECIKHFPQYIPSTISVLERRVFQECARHTPIKLAFSFYFTYYLIKRLLTRLAKRLIFKLFKRG